MYGIAGNFHGVLIFVIFVVDFAVTKVNDYQYVDAQRRSCALIRMRWHMAVT